MWRLKSVWSTSAGGVSALLKSSDKRRLANNAKPRQKISVSSGFTTERSSRPAAWSENKETFCRSTMVLAPLCRLKQKATSQTGCRIRTAYNFCLERRRWLRNDDSPHLPHSTSINRIKHATFIAAVHRQAAGQVSDALKFPTKDL